MVIFGITPVKITEILRNSEKKLATIVVSNFAARVNKLKIGDIFELNKVIKKVDSYCKIKFVHLPLKRSITLYCFSDASLQNNQDSSTQSGQAIFVGPKTSNNKHRIPVNILYFCSKKLKRIVKSTFSGELFSLS